MQPKTWWIITIVVLVLLLPIAIINGVITHIAGTMTHSESVMLLYDNFILASLLFWFFTLLLYTLKTREGLYLAGAYGVYQLVLVVYYIGTAVFNLLESSQGPEFMKVGRIFGGVISLIASAFLLVIAILLVYGVLQSKPIFKAAKLPPKP